MLEDQTTLLICEYFRQSKWACS